MKLLLDVHEWRTARPEAPDRAAHRRSWWDTGSKAFSSRYLPAAYSWWHRWKDPRRSSRQSSKQWPSSKRPFSHRRCWRQFYKLGNPEGIEPFLLSPKNLLVVWVTFLIISMIYKARRSDPRNNDLKITFSGRHTLHVGVIQLPISETRHAIWIFCESCILRR